MNNTKKETVIATNIKALRLVAKWRKWFIPSVILSALFNNLSPYITIYMSAEIINELARAKNTSRLTALVLITIIADLVILIIGCLFTKLKDYEWQSFENCERQMFIEHGFTMDYEHLENPEIQKKRGKIDESRNINNFGIWAMLNSLQNISTNIIRIVLSVCFAASLFTLIFKQSGDMIGAVYFPIIIVLLIVLSVFISLKNANKLTKLGDDIMAIGKPTVSGVSGFSPASHRA
jgi:ATP-binding cassette subfamily B protein